MQESHYSNTKTSALIRVFDEIGFQASLLALDAALDRPESETAFGADTHEIRSLTGPRRAAPADQAVRAGELAALTQSLHDVLDRLRIEMENSVSPDLAEPRRTTASNAVSTDCSEGLATLANSLLQQPAPAAEKMAVKRHESPTKS